MILLLHVTHNAYMYVNLYELNVPQLTILLAHDPVSPLDYLMATHTPACIP